MFQKNEKVTADAQKALENAMDLVNTSIHSVEKLTHIQLENSRQIIEETSKAIKELANVTDPKEVFARVNAMAAQAVEKNIASARDVYDVVNEVQSKINQLAEEGVHNIQQAALSSVEGMSQYNPNGSKAISDSLKNWINSTNQALSAMNKVASQLSEFTNSNINAASSATANAVKKSTKK